MQVEEENNHAYLDAVYSSAYYINSLFVRYI